MEKEFVWMVTGVEKVDGHDQPQSPKLYRKEENAQKRFEEEVESDIAFLTEEYDEEVYNLDTNKNPPNGSWVYQKMGNFYSSWQVGNRDETEIQIYLCKASVLD